MKYAHDSLLNPKSIRLEKSSKMLESLRRLNGGYLASPNPGQPDGTGRYDVYWLRDIMYATYANEYLGNFEHMIESYELIMTIMLKYHHKICDAVRKIPKKWALHARFHPNTLEELSADWGHHQLDVLGLFLYKTGDLIKKGHQSIVSNHDQKDLIKDLIQYLFTHRWESIPDFGMWEEGPEVHSSSVGSVLAGLTMWFDDGHYHHKYKQDIRLSSLVQVSERYFDTGWDSLNKILPRESLSRECDMAQLSLIWPYNIVPREMQILLIENIEKNLVRENAVIRYPNDWYFNSDPNNKGGHEAEWPLGLLWLAIVHNKIAARGDGLLDSLNHLKKSKEYLLKVDTLMVDDAIPELYVGGKPNENTPLAWAHSFHIIALQSFLNTIEEMRTRHKVEISEDLEPISN